MKKIIIGWVALSLTVNIQAGKNNILQHNNTEKVWSLQECIDYAHEHNIDIQMNQARIQQQEINLNTTRNQRLPDLSANVGQRFSFGRTPSGYDNTYQDRNSSSLSWSVSTSVPLFTGFRITNEIAKAKLDLETVAAELENMKETVEVTILSSYLQILYNKELLSIANEQAELSREQLTRIKKMHEHGRASESLIHEAESQIANDELSVIEAESELQLSILALTQILELPTPKGFDVEEPKENVYFRLIHKPNMIYEKALISRPSIQAEELRLKSHEKNIKIAQSAYFPTLSLGAGYSNNYYKINGFDNTAFSTQLKNNRSEYFGLNLNIPIFNRLSTRNNVRSAKLNVLLQKLQLENTKKSLYKEIQQAYYNALTSEKRYKAAESAYKSAEKAFSFMTEKLNSGRATMYEYYDSKTIMAKALSNRTQAKYNFIFRKKILEFYERQETVKYKKYL